MKRFSWLRSRTVKTLRREIHLSWLDVKRNFATPGIQPTMMQNVGMPLKVFSTQAMVLGTADQKWSQCYQGGGGGGGGLVSYPDPP